MQNSMRMRNFVAGQSRAAACRLAIGLALSGMLAGGMSGCETSSGGGGRAGGGAAPQQATVTTPVAHDSWAALGYRLDWRGFATVGRGNRVTQFALGDDVLAVQESGSRVSLLEKRDGSMRWTNELSSRLTRFVGLGLMRDRVLASSQSELMWLDTATGNVVVRQPFSKVVSTPPMISGGIAVYGTSAGEIVGHVLSNGVKLWGFQTSGVIDQPPVDVNGVAGVVAQSGDVYFVDPQSGMLYGGGRMFAGTRSAPTAGDGAMYIAGLDQSLWAFEPSGAVRWRFRTESPLTARPTHHNGAVYCEVPGLGLVSVDARTGRQRWASSEARGTVVAQRSGMLVVFAGSQSMLVDPTDGTIVARESIPDVAMLIAEGFVDGPIYAVSASGSISRFIPRR